ncbi:MAG: hypothetical protein E7213_09015 [Clostridium sp.]|nr:hypothetical protein [Clostridium sp.]
MDNGFNIENRQLKVDYLNSKVLKIDRSSIFGCKIESGDEIESSIFKEQYINATKSLIDIINTSNIFNEIENIVTFVGERGSGKTTILRSFSKCLIDKNDVLLSSNEQFNFEVLKLIDLNYKDENTSILSVILSSMYRSFLNGENIENQNFKKDLEDAFERIFKQINHISTDDASIFEFNDKFLIKESISELIKLYLDYLKKDYFVIPIDNISNLKEVKNVIHELKMYFNCEKLIILLTMDKNLIDKSEIDIEDIGVYSNVIYIEPIDILSKKIEINRDELSNIPVYNGNNIFEQIRCILVRKFNYYIYTVDAIKALVGNNVKNIIKSIVFINSLNGIAHKDEYALSRYLELLSQEALLGGKQTIILKNILKTDINELNKYIVVSLSELIVHKKKIGKVTEEIDEFYSYISNNRYQIKSGRISIGDVITCIEVFKLYKTKESDSTFIELLKASYTIKLLLEYNKEPKNIIKTIGNDYCGDYFKFIHGIDKFDNLIEIAGKKSAEDLKAFFGYRKELFNSILQPCCDYNDNSSKFIHDAVNIFKEEDIYNQKYYKFKFLNILSYSLLNRYNYQIEPKFILYIMNVDYWTNVLQTLGKNLKKGNIAEDRYFAQTIEIFKEILEKNKLFNITQELRFSYKLNAKGIEGDFIINDNDVEFLQNLNNELIKAQYLYSYNM